MSETKTKNLCTVPAADLTDSQYFIAEDGGELKRIPKVQVVLKKLENMLATDTENLAGGGEVTAQELLDALAEQVANKLLAKSQVVNNLLATVEGNPLDATQGKALKELIDTTNNNLGNINSRLDTSLSSSVLDYALTLPEGMHTVRFPGDSYTGADTPNSYYRYSGATIIVRSKGKVVTVLLYGISTKAPLAVNSYDGGKWKGWDQYVTKDDLGIYFTAAGSKAAIYKQNVISVSIQLKAGHTYFLVGKNGVSISNDGPMSATFDVLSDAGSIFHLGNSRTTMSNGGGCVTAMIIKTVKDCTVNLIGYGYVNETYNYEGRIIAIQLT